MVEERRHGSARRRSSEPRRWTLQRDDRRERARGRPHGRGDRREPGLTLVEGLGEPLCANSLELRGERRAVGDGPRRVPTERAVRKRSPGERQHDLPGRGGVADRRSPQLAHVLDGVALGTKSTVTASSSPGTWSVAVSPVSRTSSSRCGRATRRTSSRARTAFARWTTRMPRRYRPVWGSCSTRPVVASVPSCRETVLGVRPVRRASSFVPTSPASASASRIATARCAARCGRPTVDVCVPRSIGSRCAQRFAVAYSAT